MKYYPLSNTFAAVSILGLVVAGVGTYNGTFGLTWGTTFILFFTILFIASLLTMKETVYQRY